MVEPRVLITTYYLHPGCAVDLQLQAAGMETVFSSWRGDRTEREMIELLQGIDGVVAASDPYSKQVLESTTRLKVIARSGVGYETVDLKAATARGIAVCNAPGANRHAVADYTMALILQLSRRLRENLAEVWNGGWTRHEGRDLAGSTLGIVGMGTIGREVAQRARGFEMRVLATDVKRDELFAGSNEISYVPLDELLRESDYITLHCFLDDSTRHLINAERLALMKPTTYLINTSRGPVVDEEALYQALKEKKIAGAALDVVEKEPLSDDSPLRSLSNLLLSPHAAGSSSDARSEAGKMAAENVIRLLRAEKPLSILNPEVLPLRR